MSKRFLHYGWIIISAGFLTVLGAHGFRRFAYSLVLKDMKVALNLDYFQLGLIATGNFIGYLAFATIGGALASKYGSRKVITLSVIVMGVTMILTGAANTFFEVFVLRLITGLGHGSSYLPAMALPSIWFAMKLRGRATGYVSAGIGVGFSLAGVIVPLVLTTYGADGWRYAWFYLGTALLLIGVVDLLLIRNKPEDLGLKPVGYEERPNPKNDPESSQGGSSFQWRLVYASKEIWLVGIVYFMYGFSYIIYITFFAAYLQTVFGWTIAEASSLWFMVGILSIFSGIIWGWISDVLGRKYGIALAYIVLMISYILYAMAFPPVGIYASAILFGIAAWSVPTVSVVAAADYVEPKLRSAAAGFVTLFFGIGQAFGPAAGGYAIEATKVFANAFYIAAVVSLIGGLGALLLRKPPKA